jgi:hypothetical protein
VPDPQPGLDESFLEREGTANRERHKIIAPDVAQIGRFVYDDPVSENLVARGVRPDVHVIAERRENPIARIGDGKNWTGFRVLLAEQQKFAGPVSRKDREVGLHATRGKPRCLAGVPSSSYHCAQFDRVGRKVHLCPRCRREHVHN